MPSNASSDDLDNGPHTAYMIRSGPSITPNLREQVAVLLLRFFQHVRTFTQSLRFKLSFYAGLVAFAAIMAFAFHSISTQEKSLVGARLQGAVRNAEVIKAAIWNGMMTKNRQVIREIVEAIGQEKNFLCINIYDSSGVLHYSSREDLKDRIGKKLDRSRSTRLLDGLAVNQSLRYDYNPVTNVADVVNPLVNTKSCSTVECHAHPESQKVLGALEMQLTMKGLRTEVRSVGRNILFFATFLFLVLSTMIGLGVTFLVNRPVEALREQAEKIATGDYSTSAPSTGSDSIARLSIALEEMRRQIKQREVEIQQSRRMYKELFDKAPCYFAVVDPDHRIVRENQACVAAFGDRTGEHCYKFFKNRESECTKCQVDQTFLDGISRSVPDVWDLPDGTKAHVIVHTAPIVNEEGKITEVLEMAVDVTFMVKLQEELSRQEEQFRTLFENVPCYLTVVDSSYRLGFFNRMFARDFGSAWGEKCFAAYKGRTEKCDPCPVEMTFLDGESHYSEEIWNREGKDQHIVVRTSPMKNSSGEIIAVMEMCTNITELRVMENQLALLGETIAGTSHAIKNILSGLEGGVYIVDSGMRSGNELKMRSGWGIVKKNVVKVSELVKDILYASKEREPELKEIDPGKVLQEVYELFEDKANKENIRLIKEFDARMGEGMWDPHAIHTAVSNLISNAMGAFSESMKPDHQIVLRARAEKCCLFIQIADNGQGMSDEVKQNLFKKFYSTKGAKGTGLGLLVTRKVVEESRGTITFESTLGEGTSFLIKLPFWNGESRPAAAANPAGDVLVRVADHEPDEITNAKQEAS